MVRETFTGRAIAKKMKQPKKSPEWRAAEKFDKTRTIKMNASIKKMDVYIASAANNPDAKELIKKERASPECVSP